jgi:hypothetical protein
MSTGPPDRGLTEQQLTLLNQSLDALHEEVAAARAPSTWPFVLFVLSILLPLAAGIWLIFRAEHSQLGHDEQLRWLIRSGMTPTVIHAYLEQSHRPQLQGPQDPKLTFLRRPIMPPRRRWRRRRHRQRRRRIRRKAA